jgi:small-conductance mechanosensitive channel
MLVRDGMPVTVANRQIIILRGPIAGYSAGERATAAMERINLVLDTIPDAIVTVEPADDGSTRVRVGGDHAFLVTAIDIDAQAGETTRLVAQAASQRLDQAILERHEQQTPRYLTEALGFASAATLLYGTLLWLIFRFLRWARGRLTRWADDHPRKLELIGWRFIDTGQALLIARRALGLVAWAIAVVLASGWLSFVLERFPYTRPWGEQLGHRLLRIAADAALAVVAALPGLLVAIVIFLIARAVTRLVAAVFDRVERGEREVGWVDADTARPTRRIFYVLVWVFALALAYPHLPGAQTDAFKGVSVLVGLMISLGASSVVGQAFNGFILMYGRAFRSGDYVRIGEHEGTVELLGTFTTRLRTGLGDELILPNSVVMAASIRNYSRSGQSGGCVIDSPITVGYAVPWRQVHAMLQEAARRTEGIAGEPAPYVRQTALADFYVEYRLVAYTTAEDPEKRMDVLSRLHGGIQDVFNEHGVQMMSPHYMADPAAPLVVPKERWYAPPAKPPDRKG